MTDRPRRGRDKDASTRFMRVDQLFGGKTVEVPAATMLARAASDAGRPAAARREEPPTVAMPTVAAKPLPATTALRGRDASSRPHTAHPPEKDAGAVSRSRPAGKYLVLVAALTIVGALVHATARRSASEPSAKAPVVAPPVVASAMPPLPASVAGDAHAAQAAPPTSAPNAAVRASLPSIAADQLAAGDHAAALGSYRELARLWPEERVYSLVAEVLEHRLSARCARGAGLGALACER